MNIEEYDEFDESQEVEILTEFEEEEIPHKKDKRVYFIELAFQLFIIFSLHMAILAVSNEVIPYFFNSDESIKCLLQIKPAIIGIVLKYLLTNRLTGPAIDTIQNIFFHRTDWDNAKHISIITLTIFDVVHLVKEIITVC